MALLERDVADLVFRPDVGELYPADDLTRVSVEGLTRQLEGASRPGHLDGLTTVMLKLINLVGPARVYLGQKHAQQVVILRRMMRDLFMNVELVVCPTVREADGLAMSSANARLSIEERRGGHLPLQRPHRGAHGVRRRRAIGRGAAGADAGGDGRGADGADRLPQRRRCGQSLAELQRVSGPALALVAGWIGRTRLADNMPLAWDVA